MRSGHFLGGKESPVPLSTLSTVVCGSNDKPFSRLREGGASLSLLLLLLLDKSTTRPATTATPAMIAMRWKGFIVALGHQL